MLCIERKNLQKTFSIFTIRITKNYFYYNRLQASQRSDNGENVMGDVSINSNLAIGSLIFEIPVADENVISSL